MCRDRNCEILKVGAVSFHSRSLEFGGKTIGCHTKTLLHGMDVFKSPWYGCFQMFLKGAWQG